MGFLDVLKKDKPEVKVTIDDEWLIHSLESPELELLQKIADDDESGKAAIKFYRHNGFSNFEKNAYKSAQDKMDNLQKDYFQLLASLSRQHQISQDEINRTVSVSFPADAQVRIIERVLAIANSAVDDKLLDKEQAENFAESVNKISQILDVDTQEKIKQQKQRNLEIVQILGEEDFGKLTKLNDDFIAARDNYYYEIVAYVLSNPRRIVKLNKLSEADQKAFKFTVYNVKNLHNGLFNAVLNDYIGKELAGKNGWDDDLDTVYLTSKFDGKALTVEGDAKLIKGATYQVTAIKIEEAPAEEGKDSKKSGKS